MSQTPHREGRESRGTSSLPPDIMRFQDSHPPQYAHTLLQERLCIFDEESVGAPTVEKQIKLFSCLFLFTQSSPLSQGSAALT